MTISKYIRKKTDRFHDDYVIENIQKAHRNFLEDPSNRISLYDSKNRNMPNSTRYSQKNFEVYHSMNSSNGSREVSDQNDSDAEHPSVDLPQEMTHREMKNFDRYLKNVSG